MKKTKIFAVVLASLACAVLLGSCDYWKEEWFAAQGSTESTASGGSGQYTSGIDYFLEDDAAFKNEFSNGDELLFACDGDLSDGKPHQGRARVRNREQETVLEEGTFQGTFKEQFTFVLNGTTYVGKFRLKSGRSGESHTDWGMDIYNSSGTTLLCTTVSSSRGTGWTRIETSPLGTIWDTSAWR